MKVALFAKCRLNLAALTVFQSTNLLASSTKISTLPKLIALFLLDTCIKNIQYMYAQSPKQRRQKYALSTCYFLHISLLIFTYFRLKLQKNFILYKKNSIKYKILGIIFNRGHLHKWFPSAPRPPLTPAFFSLRYASPYTLDELPTVCCHQLTKNAQITSNPT